MYCHLLQNVHHFYLECDICSFVTFFLMLFNSFNVDILLHLFTTWVVTLCLFCFYTSGCHKNCNILSRCNIFVCIEIYVWMVCCDELRIVLANFCDNSSFCYTSLVNDMVYVMSQWSAHGTLIYGLVDSCSV
jgi:hypothetical protein